MFNSLLNRDECRRNVYISSHYISIQMLNIQKKTWMKYIFTISGIIAKDISGIIATWAQLVKEKNEQY